MKELESLFDQWQNLQPLKPEYQKKLDNKLMLDFNFNSNHMEGNTLNYGQTKLLFIFGKTSGNAPFRDYEEMKAHNVGLELIKREAADTERPLTENLVRELNRIILVENFHKRHADGQSTYEIHVGIYKTRPNHVITLSGETFYYATPEETPAMMTDLINRYNETEQSKTLSPVELAALMHYRFIRIHPFEDGNGRIARLLVNYILIRHGYPMVIVRNEDKENYLNILNECDINVGLTPSDGANAQLEDIQPLVDYLKKLTIGSLKLGIRAAKGEKIDEDTDWKKALILKQKQAKEKPLYTQALAKQANEESFLFLVKKVDDELSTFYDLFDKIVYGDETNTVVSEQGLLSTTMLNSSFNRRGFHFSKTLISKGTLSAFFELRIEFENQHYSLIAKLANNEEKQLRLDFNYSETITEEIATEYVAFVGEFIAEFVNEQLN